MSIRTPEKKALSRSRKFLIRLQGKLWPVPALLAIGGAGFGVLMPLLDQLVDARLLHTTVSGAREVLSTSAGSLATVLGVTFSVTVVTLQLAATQYSSRILRRFMADRVTQALLGVFLGSVTYLFVVLRTVRSGEEKFGAFIPSVSLLFGLLLTIGCLSLLAYFVHHLVRSIQVATIVMGIGKETMRTAQDLRPLWSTPALAKPPAARHTGCICARTNGYIQAVALDELLETSPASIRLLTLEVEVGDFVLKGTPLIRFDGELHDPAQQKRLAAAVVLGRERTPNADVLFGVRQLVDIGLKALSPGINDVTTAMMAVNELGAIVLEVARTGLRAERTYRERTVDRMSLLYPTFGLEDVAVHAFTELSWAACEHPRVLARMLELLSQIAALLSSEEQRQALYRVASRVFTAGQQSPHEPTAQAMIEQEWRQMTRTAQGVIADDLWSPTLH
jgi:uncharacterized membrane protein